MCPLCITTAALIAASLASTGGTAVIAMKAFSSKGIAKQGPEPNASNSVNSSKENPHG